MSRPAHVIGFSLTVAAVAASIPPLNGILTGHMLTHMLVQIPLVFACAATWGTSVRWRVDAPWLRWNIQGVPGLLLSAFVLTYWMTPIALDHATADGAWDLAKILSLGLAGAAAGVSWRLGSAVVQVFYVGNMLWMMGTAGLLYQDTDERLCNAYLWNDQLETGEGLVAVSILCACVVLLIAVRTRRRHPPLSVPAPASPAP
jgi:hypothetical protein